MRSAVAGKARVHELAKELGVESKVVLRKLRELGEFVKSASSTVEAPVARRLRAALTADAGDRNDVSVGGRRAADQPGSAIWADGIGGSVDGGGAPDTSNDRSVHAPWP